MAAPAAPESACTAGWIGFVAATWQLTFEASMVVPLRLARMAGGGDEGAREARLMVEEKVEALGGVLGSLGAGRFGTSPGEIANGAMRHYLGYVRANRRRLMGGK